MLAHLLPEGLSKDVTFMDYGLHRVPKNMTGTLQESIDKIEEPSLVVLGYGLCGNGLNGIKAGVHTLLIPRSDDCIAILLGSYRAYRREFKAVPGTYYLTKGWLESGSNPLQEYEEYALKYGADRALWVMDQQYQHYERLVLVARDQADLEKYRPQAQEILGCWVTMAESQRDGMTTILYSFHPAAKSVRPCFCARPNRSIDHASTTNQLSSQRYAHL
jgi:hypothetical protein